MVRISINLRSKYIFFGMSGLTAMYLIYQINVLTSSINMLGMDKILYFLLIFICAAFFWIPYQYNEQFT